MTSENICFFLSDTAENQTDEGDINNLLNEFYSKDFEMENDSNMDDINFSLLVDYSENNTVKQLMRICEYYNISKELKLTKPKKIDIVNAILIFENDYDNKEIVRKRKQMWHYIEELRNDKFMKQFVFWG